MKRRYDPDRSNKRAAPTLSVVSARAVHASFEGPKLQDLVRHKDVWDVPPKGLDRVNVHALKLFAKGCCDKDSVPSEILKLKEPRKLDFAHSWIARFIGDQVYSTPLNAALAFAEKAAKSTESEKPAADLRPLGVRRFVQHSEDLMFDKNTAVIFASSSAEVRNVYGDINFAKIAKNIYLGRVQELKNQDCWLYPESTPNPDHFCIEVLNAYPVTTDSEDDLSLEIEGEVKKLIEKSGFSVRKVWSSDSTLPYTLRRVFATVDGNIHEAAKQLGTGSVHGRPLLVAINKDRRLQR